MRQGGSNEAGTCHTKDTQDPLARNERKISFYMEQSILTA